MDKIYDYSGNQSFTSIILIVSILLPFLSYLDFSTLIYQLNTEMINMVVIIVLETQSI